MIKIRINIIYNGDERDQEDGDSQEQIRKFQDDDPHDQEDDDSHEQQIRMEDKNEQGKIFEVFKPEATTTKLEKKDNMPTWPASQQLMVKQ